MGTSRYQAFLRGGVYPSRTNNKRRLRALSIGVSGDSGGEFYAAWRCRRRRHYTAFCKLRQAARESEADTVDIRPTGSNAARWSFTDTYTARVKIIPQRGYVP
jgi:hypothetical protein